MDNAQCPSGGCHQCPRDCGVLREAGAIGYCGMPAELYVSRIAPHRWEEPPISGTCGSGTVFFTGCSLRCVFCQNRDISRTRLGTPLTEEVTCPPPAGVGGQRRPQHQSGHADALHRATRACSGKGQAAPAHSGRLEQRRLRAPCDAAQAGRVGGHLPARLQVCLSRAGWCSFRRSGLSGNGGKTALAEMYRQVGGVQFTEDGTLLRRGVLVRHLVLPGCRRDSCAVLGRIRPTAPRAGYPRIGYESVHPGFPRSPASRFRKPSRQSWSDRASVRRSAGG